jgi:AraC family transcriptional regulator
LAGSFVEKDVASMSCKGAYGERLGDSFGVQNVPMLLSTTLRRTPIAVTLVQSDAPAEVMSDPLPSEDAVLVHLNLKACPDHELWVDGLGLGKRTFNCGETAIHDLRRNPAALIRTAMGSMMFYLSRKVINEICDDANARYVADIPWVPGLAIDDPIIRNLGHALLGSLEHPKEATHLFVDHVTRAVAVHVASTYGGMRRVSAIASGGLAPWQERLAKEMLFAHLDGELSISALAAECGLSVSHFTKAFRKSCGQPPHRWLQRQRLEQAKSQLGGSGLPIAEVATACGFYDQSHFTRCFKSAFGVGPGAWRRHLEIVHADKH